eukprot:637385-Amphidinium_carterae.3
MDFIRKLIGDADDVMREALTRVRDVAQFFEAQSLSRESRGYALVLVRSRGFSTHAPIITKSGCWCSRATEMTLSSTVREVKLTQTVKVKEAQGKGFMVKDRGVLGSRPGKT